MGGGGTEVELPPEHTLVHTSTTERVHIHVYTFLVPPTLLL